MFISFLAAFLGPLLGILISDYYFVRKKKLNVDKLYNGTKSYNWLGFVALIIGGVFGLLFVQISWMVGLPISALIYWAGYKFLPSYQKELMNDFEGTREEVDVS